jgi:uncharacterized protein DUF4190
MKLTSHRLATASVVLACTSPFIYPVGSLAGIICGHIALSRMTREKSSDGKRRAIVGLIVGYVLFTIMTIILSLKALSGGSSYTPTGG